MQTVEEVLQLYTEKYFDFNVQHEKLRDLHGIDLSYTCVKDGAANRGASKAPEEVGLTPQATASSPFARHDAAHRWQRAPLVRG